MYFYNSNGNSLKNDKLAQPATLKNKPYPDGLFFLLFWAIVFILYIPAINAGFVTDFSGWLDQVENKGFWEYINRSNFTNQSLYQFTQFTTYIFYQLFGIHAWLWHLLHVTLQATNSYLLYRLCRQLFVDAGIKGASKIALTGTILFCISPYLSEVIVWEPSFHYLQGLLLILLTLICAQKYLHTQKIKYALYAAIIYFLSTYSLEIFYITPWLVLFMALYYRVGLGYGRRVVNKVLLYFFVAELVLFAAHLLAYHLFYGDWVAHIGTASVADIPATGLGKPAKYIFHLVFLGRFFPPELKKSIYAFCDSTKGIFLFYAFIGLVCALIATRFRKLEGKGKAASLLFVWVLVTLAILLPLWFSDLFFIAFDRYAYFAAAFLYMLLALLISYIPGRYAGMAIVVVYALINIRFTIKVNRFWGKSARVIHGLLYSLPDVGNKTVILLNLPEMMQGAPMIDAAPDAEYKLMHNLLLPDKKVNNTIYDGVAYNMITPEDGAHVMVLNDSTIRVTLNQWGTWWWYKSLGAGSYENDDYKLKMIDNGHFYELTLKKTATQYLLLYQVGDKWKVADWNIKNQDQN